MAESQLKSLGWNPFFEQQLPTTDEPFLVARVAAHHSSQLILLTPNDELTVATQLTESCGDIAVGDWLVLDPETLRAKKRLDRQTLLERKAPGEKVKSQLIAANIDTLFIVSSCNQEYSLSRLERYLALCLEAGPTPIVVLTKADLCDDPVLLRQQVEKLRSGLIVESLDARDSTQSSTLAEWCRTGQTVALVGSSGVGKSTLATALGAGAIATGEIREDDAKGRHTTTARSIYRLSAGGMLIDNPGIRELQLPSCEQGIRDLFDDIVTLFDQCRFRNCGHEGDAGCAVEQALESGQLDPRRLKSYRKLQSEQARNAESLAQRREKDKQLGKLYKDVQHHNRKVRKGR